MKCIRLVLYICCGLDIFPIPVSGSLLKIVKVVIPYLFLVLLS